MPGKIVLLEIDDEMKQTAKDIVKLLPPDDKEKAYAIICFIRNIMKEKLGVQDDEMISVDHPKE